MQVVGVGVCNCSQLCWVTANQNGFLLPRTGPSWEVLWTQCRLDCFSVLACCWDVQRALGWSGWDEVTSSVPCQNRSDENLPSQCMRSQLSARFSGTGSSWCVVILWRASSLCSDLFLPQNDDQSYMLVYTSSKFLPGIFILQLFKPYYCEWSVWSGFWRRKLILSQFNVRYSVYFKSAVYKMVTLLLTPWQDFRFSLIRYGVWLNVGWGLLSRSGYCIYLCSNWDWYPLKSQQELNKI